MNTKLYLKSLLYSAIIWMILFLLLKVFFLLFQQIGITWIEAARAIFYGLPTDIAMVFLLMIIPAFFISLHFLYPSSNFQRAAYYFFLFETVIYSLVAYTETGIYYELKTKINIPYLLHLSHPSEVIRTVSGYLFVIFISGIVICTLLVSFLFKKWVFPLLESVNLNINPDRLRFAAFVFIVSLIFLIGKEGGVKGNPLSGRNTFFSKNPCLNEATVNPLWGFGVQALNYKKKLTENPFVVMEKEEMKRTVNSLYAVPKDTTVHFMTTSRPNIVFIILESWSAQMIKAFGGDNFAPFTDSLCRSGIYFSQFYANSNVSDQGIPAVLSGYPSCTENQIVNIIFKTHKMPAINQELEKIGYETAFYYGSNLSYGNIRLYVEDKKFQKIVDENELGNSGKLTSLGIHDKDMAKIFLGELNHAKHPFFYAWFTVSSHSPYRIPEPYRKRTESSQNPYINTIIYADEALKLFFQEARKQPWYNNTLFVLVSDHSHATHKPYWPHQKEFHQIPLVFFGNVIKEEFRGKNIDKVFSQTDIVPTLLRQMDLPSHRYIFGKNMMNPYTKPFAFYPFSRGCGYITSEGTVATAEWMKDTIEVQENKGKLKVAQVKQEMYALRQWLYDDFISR